MNKISTTLLVSLALLCGCATQQGGGTADQEKVVCRLGLVMQNGVLSDFVSREAQVKACTRIIEGNTLTGKELGSFYYARGDAWQGVKEDDRALADYNQAIQLGAANADVYFSRGLLLKKKNELDRAAADFEQAVKLDPKYKFALYQRGRIYASRNDWANAETSYRLALLIDPDNTDFLNGHGYVLTYLEKYDEAMADFDKVIKLDPNDWYAYQNRGDIWSRKKEYDKAIADYNKTILLEEEPAYAYSGRARARLEKGDAGCMADFDQAVKLKPKYRWPYSERGHAAFRLGLFAQARRDLMSANELDTEPFASTWTYNAIWAYLAQARQGDADKQQLRRDLEHTKQGPWPKAIMSFLLNEGKPAELFAAAESANPKTLREQRCEANFYVAQMFMIRKDTDSARPLFKEAAANCPPNFREYFVAIAEFQRLEPIAGAAR